MLAKERSSPGVLKQVRSAKQVLGLLDSGRVQTDLTSVTAYSNWVKTSLVVKTWSLKTKIKTKTLNLKTKIKTKIFGLKTKTKAKTFVLKTKIKTKTSTLKTNTKTKTLKNHNHTRTSIPYQKLSYLTICCFRILQKNNTKCLLQRLLSSLSERSFILNLLWAKAEQSMYFINY